MRETHRLASKIIFSFLSLNPLSLASLLSAHTCLSVPCPLTFNPGSEAFISESEPESTEFGVEATTPAPGADPDKAERRSERLYLSIRDIGLVVVILEEEEVVGRVGEEGAEGGLTEGGRRAVGGE